MYHTIGETVKNI